MHSNRLPYLCKLTLLQEEKAGGEGCVMNVPVLESITCAEIAQVCLGDGFDIHHDSCLCYCQFFQASMLSVLSASALRSCLITTVAAARPLG